MVLLLARMARLARRAIRSPRAALRAAAFVALTATTAPLQAQDFPTGNVRFIVPFPAGGSSDILSRKIADVLSREWKKPIIIDNVVGGANIVGIQAAIRDRPMATPLSSSRTCRSRSTR